MNHERVLQPSALQKKEESITADNIYSKISDASIKQHGAGNKYTQFYFITRAHCSWLSCVHRIQMSKSYTVAFVYIHMNHVKLSHSEIQQSICHSFYLRFTNSPHVIIILTKSKIIKLRSQIIWPKSITFLHTTNIILNIFTLNTIGAYILDFSLVDTLYDYKFSISFTILFLKTITIHFTIFICFSTFL